MPQSIFHDQESDSEKRQQSTGIVGIDTQKYCKNRVAGVGQNFIIHKFQELMLKKRKRREMDEMQDDPLPSKRQKKGRGHKDIESSFAESEYLKKYINQRQLVTNTQKARYLKSLRKVGLINLSEIGKQSKIAVAAKSMKERKQLANEQHQRQDEEDHADKENKAEEEDDHVAPEVVALDFCARKFPLDAKRQFLLNYCKNDGEDTTQDSDGNTQKIPRLNKLCDDELMKKDLEIKLNSPTMKEQSLQRQNSHLQPEQQQSEVVDNAPPQKVTVTQKEELQIIQKSFGELFTSFKNSQVASIGIGGGGRGYGSRGKV